MPFYDFACSGCGHTFERTLKIADMKKPEGEPCPVCQADNTVFKTLPGAPAIGDPVRLGVRKPNGDFKEVLQKIHERTYKSNLNLKYS